MVPNSRFKLDKLRQRKVINVKKSGEKGIISDETTELKSTLCIIKGNTKIDNDG
jgi:hypothetical protein